MSKKKEKICSKCQQSKKLDTEFYIASSDLIHADGRLSICKSCLEELVNYDDIHSVVNAMRMIDRPFLKQEYEKAKKSSKPFGEYMRRLGMPQYRWLNYSDSMFDGTTFELPENKKPEIELDNVTLSELRKKWGYYKDESDYLYLENFYNEYAQTYATDTPAQKNLYKNIARVQLEAEKELADGNTTMYKDLMNVSSKLHADGGIKPSQSDKKDENSGLHSYGMWIKEIEKEEPCEYFENKPAYEDYDQFKKYIDKWFVRPFKNIFNISRDFDVKDD